MRIGSIIENLTTKEIVRITIFTLAMLTISWYYNYHETIQYRPTSKHVWRNTVSASIALNYYHQGAFFHPRTHNMQVDDFSSDITITEFPAIYYFIGMLYRIFGFHEWIYKLVQLLIGFIGLYYLFKTGYRMFGDMVYAMVLPLLVFTSPMFVYYLNNFIPDAPSLSIALVSIYFFYRYYQTGTFKYLVISMLVTTFAGLIKAPAFMLFFVVVALMVLETVFRNTFRANEKLFRFNKQNLLLLSGTFILVVSWYTYAKIYTDHHGGDVSQVAIRPIWILSTDTISTTWQVIKNRFWEGQYHSPYFLILIGALFIYNMVRWKKYNRLFNWLLVLYTAGGGAFSLFFFRSLKNHDYYQMNNLVIPVLVIINFVLYLKNNHANIFQSIITKAAFAGIIIYMIISCKTLINNHYYNGWFEWDARQRYNNMYNDITPYLRSLGIERTDKVYCTPDPSINISLYLMDQKGFTDFYRNKFPFSEKLELFKNKGLKYVIIGDPEVPDISPEEAGMEKIGEHNGACIYEVLNH